MKVDNTNVVESKKFHINSSYKEFTDRQKNVFDQLGAIEQSTHNTLSKNDTCMETNELSDSVDIHESNTLIQLQDSNLRHLQGKESLFKKPLARPLKHIKTLLNRKVPDYQINPHKWTRYSLDIPQEDMSERANASAAMLFLKELERRNQEDKSNVSDNTTKKITFNKTTPKPTDAAETSVSFRNSKIIMPEYVVGQKMKKPKVKRSETKPSSSAVTEIKLDHISKYDDGDDDIN